MQTDLQPIPDTNRTVPAKKQPQAIKLSRRLKSAIDLMVWDCLTDSEAAVRTKSHVQTIRLALKQPNARAYFREQCEMLRSRENPRNTHTLIAIRDQDANQMARVAAIKELERSSDQQVTGGATRSPGVVVIIQQAGPVPVQPSVQRMAHTDHITQVIDNADE